MFDTLIVDGEMADWLTETDRRDAALPLIPDDDATTASATSPVLGDLEPGILLGAVLSSIDVRALSGHDRVAVMAAYQRMASHYQAQLYAAMASVADAVSDTLREDGETDLELAEQASSSEIRAALRLTRRAADSELAIARSFQTRLPEVWEALLDGRIDRRRANLIVHRTDHLSMAEARQVAHTALTRASDLTTGQLTAWIRRLCAESDPDDARNRFESAVEQRRVVLDASFDGTAHLHLMDLPPDRATRIRDRIDSIARGLKSYTEIRSMDQLRADVALDLLDPSSSSRSGRRGALVMTVDLATLVGLADHAGDLGGYGPVIADVARQVAESSASDEWRFVVTDQDRRPIHVGTTRRRPTASQRRLVESAFATCVFPGCRIPATQCDLDHRTPWVEGGQTTTGNLAPLCRHDHRMRHRAGWSYLQSGEGHHEWVSPLGHRYPSKARSP